MQRRVLVVDDTPGVHDVFREILTPSHEPEGAALEESLSTLEGELFGEPLKPRANAIVPCEVDMVSAYQGKDAVDMVRAAGLGQYFMAFVDMRMPPGIDGVQTIQQMWKVDPDIYVVICTAFSDYSWEEISSQLGHSPNLLILRKPFEKIEVQQLVTTVMRMYEILGELHSSIGELDEQILAQSSRLDRALQCCRHLLASTTDAVVRLDHRGIIAELNPAARDLFGQQCTEGANIERFIRYESTRHADRSGSEPPGGTRWKAARQLHDDAVCRRLKVLEFDFSETKHESGGCFLICRGEVEEAALRGAAKRT